MNSTTSMTINAFREGLRRLLRMKETDRDQTVQTLERPNGERPSMYLDEDVPAGRAGIYIPSDQRMAVIDTLDPHELVPRILTPPMARRTSQLIYGQLRRWPRTTISVMSDETENEHGWRSTDTLSSPVVQESVSPETAESSRRQERGSRKPKWLTKIGSVIKKKKNRPAPTSEATLAGASQAQMDIPAAAESPQFKPFWKRRVQVKPLINKLLHRPQSAEHIDAPVQCPSQSSNDIDNQQAKAVAEARRHETAFDQDVVLGTLTVIDVVIDDCKYAEVLHHVEISVLSLFEEHVVLGELTEINHGNVEVRHHQEVSVQDVFPSNLSSFEEESGNDERGHATATHHGDLKSAISSTRSFNVEPWQIVFPDETSSISSGELGFASSVRASLTGNTNPDEAEASQAALPRNHVPANLRPQEDAADAAHIEAARDEFLKLAAEPRNEDRDYAPGISYAVGPSRLCSIDEEDEETDSGRVEVTNLNQITSGGAVFPGFSLSHEAIEEEEQVLPMADEEVERQRQASGGVDAFELGLALSQIYVDEDSEEEDEEESDPTDVDDSEKPGSQYPHIVRAVRRQLADQYEFVRTLGAGGQSEVVLARHLPTNELRAVKCFDQNSVWGWAERDDGIYINPCNWSMEAAILHALTNEPGCPPTILKMLEYHHLWPQFAIVTEYFGEDWMDLFSFLNEAGPLTEDQARVIFHQVIRTIGWMHGKGLLHNDLKDENILINRKTLDIKLIDFGSACQVTDLQQAFCGTRKFMSPEALLCNRGGGPPWSPTKQEMWSLGTLLFVLLFGTDPWEDEYEAFQVNIRTKLSCIVARQGRQVSNDTLSLVDGLLAHDYRDRWTMEMALNAAFFKTQDQV
ncbi:Serine/threonine-protein kinase pim-2 [Geranomyces michiganensis]|nr:Serine/threonine-protein kinase pim-2 [Geranomyces michiganensis]